MERCEIEDLQKKTESITELSIVTYITPEDYNHR